MLVLLSALACSSDNRTVLIVYSPHGKELLAYSERSSRRRTLESMSNG